MADRVHPTPLSSIFDVIRETGAALATLSGLSARRERRDAADFDVTVQFAGPSATGSDFEQVTLRRRRTSGPCAELADGRA